MTMQKLSPSLIVATSLIASAAPARAQEAQASASLTQADASTTPPAPAAAERRDEPTGEKWIKRHRPTRNQLELGIFGGVMLPASDTHELYDPSRAWAPYKRVAPDVGLRLGFYPLSFLGLEVEGALIPTKLGDA